jgi:hypothetical protein
MIDSSIVRAHAQAATGQKEELCEQALGLSRGGLTCKWHIAVDTFGRPVRFILTGGDASDAGSAIPLLTGLCAEHVIADKAYDAHAILDHIEGTGARPLIPQRTCMQRKGRSIPPNTSCAIVSNAPSASSSSYAASQPDTAYPSKLSRKPLSGGALFPVLIVDSA